MFQELKKMSMTRISKEKLNTRSDCKSLFWFCLAQHICSILDLQRMEHITDMLKRSNVFGMR